MMLELLSRARAKLGDSRIGRLLLTHGPTPRVVRTWLFRTVARQQLGRPDDVTVLIGVRNRADHRLVNALKSIRGQTHDPRLVHVTVVDYGSERSSAERTLEACRRFRAEYRRVETTAVWSRSRCLNVGIRRARTKFLLASDVDILLSPGYLADAIAVLKVAPLSVICAPMLDLPSESAETFQAFAENDEHFSLDEWKARCASRFGWDFHPSIALSYTSYFQLIRGYDEYYELWGCEDADLLRRLEYLGLTARKLERQSFYLHQWHARFEGIPKGQHAEQIERNSDYFARNHSILRNDLGWGLS